MPRAPRRSVRPSPSSDVRLDNGLTLAEIVADQGARVRSLRDRCSDRELLYRRPGAHWDPSDYVSTLAGGWDQMFPNDDPWRGFPIHGALWSARFEVNGVTAEAATLGLTLQEPSVHVEHRYELMEAPRSGLRLTTTVRATDEVQPFLWSTHPMLAVHPGWRIDVGDIALTADSADPGRVGAGEVSASGRETVLSMPEAGQGWQEVLYAPATGAATVMSADEGTGTRIRWDTAFFRHLWIVTLSGFASVDLALVLEPCSSRPYRLEDAISAGTAVQLAAGEERTFWSEVESIDKAPAPP